MRDPILQVLEAGGVTFDDGVVEDCPEHTC